MFSRHAPPSEPIRRSMLEWFAYLDNQERPFTLDEFCAQMLFHIRQHLGTQSAMSQESRNATRHLEGMLATFDDFMSQTSQDYAKLAMARGARAKELQEARDERQSP